MGLPAGVSVGQVAGSTNEFGVKNGVLQKSYSKGVKVTADRGSALIHTAVQGELDLAAATSTLLAGILGHDVYDPAAVPAKVRDRIYGGGLLGVTEIGQPASVWKVGEFSLTNVNGAVAYGDFISPDTSGKWKSSTTTNNLKNGSIVCMEGNSVAAGPIVVMVNLA